MDINTIGLHLPAEERIESKVLLAGYEPWYCGAFHEVLNPDGSVNWGISTDEWYQDSSFNKEGKQNLCIGKPSGAINPVYLQRIIEILDIAERNNVKISIEVLTGIASDMNYTDKELVPVGSAKETFYFNHLESLIPEIKNHPAVLAYAVPSESLAVWSINGLNHSSDHWYEGNILSFQNRVAKKIRELDSNHLITSGEGVTPNYSPHNETWRYPATGLGLINDVDDLNNGQPYSLESIVDYISPHVYITTPDLYPILQAISERTDKPVVIGEFGFGLLDLDLHIEENQTVYSEEQLDYFSEIQRAANDSLIEGYFPWLPIPTLTIIPGEFGLEPAVYGPTITFYGLDISYSSELNTVHRFYNPTTKDHFLTLNFNEGNSLGLEYQGIAFYTFKDQIIDTIPIYRCYELGVSSNHFVSTSIDCEGYEN